MKKRILIGIVLIINNASIFAQNKINGDCVTDFANNLDFTITQSKSIYSTFSQNNEKLTLKVINPTKDTFYLFKTYFSKESYSSKYLHWIDNKKHTYTISLIPLVSNLSTHLSDRVFFGDESIRQGQNLYEFVKMNPNTYYVFDIDLNELFKNEFKKDNAVKSQNPRLLDKFHKAKFKFINVKGSKPKYDLLFSFGIYKDIRFICQSSNYYLREFEFNKAAKSFNIFELPIKLGNYKPPFLK